MRKRNLRGKLPFADFAVFGRALSSSKAVLRDSERLLALSNEISRLHEECRSTTSTEIIERNTARVDKILAEMKTIGN